jgi:hypothetical protein
MPEKTVKRWLQDCDASPPMTGRSSPSWRSWLTPSTAQSPMSTRWIYEQKPCASGVSCRCYLD